MTAPNTDPTPVVDTPAPVDLGVKYSTASYELIRERVSLINATLGAIKTRGIDTFGDVMQIHIDALNSLLDGQQP